ncbi:MAG: hypothetical protein E6J35_03050, partial [Chloroflexi bacterium]
LYAWDTRHLSRYEFRPRGGPLRLSSAEVLPDGARLEYSLGRSTRVERRIRIDSKIEDEWTIANTGARVTAFDAELVADADFRDPRWPPLSYRRSSPRLTRCRRA